MGAVTFSRQDGAAPPAAIGPPPRAHDRAARGRGDAHHARGCTPCAPARGRPLHHLHAHPAEGGVGADPALYDRITRLPHVRGHGPDGALRHGRVRRRRPADHARHLEHGRDQQPGPDTADPARGPAPTRRPAVRSRDRHASAARNEHLQLGDADRRLRAGSDGGAPRGNRCQATRPVGHRPHRRHRAAAHRPEHGPTDARRLVHGQRRRHLHRGVPRRLHDLRIAVAGGIFLVVRLDDPKASARSRPASPGQRRQSLRLQRLRRPERRPPGSSHDQRRERSRCCSSGSWPAW